MLNSMKRISIFLIMLLVTSITKAQTAEQAVVKELLNIWMSGKNNDEAKKRIKSMVSPSFLESADANKPSVEINSYAPYGYMLGQQEGHTVKAYIWGRNKNWVHAIYFRVEEEGNKYCIQPRKGIRVSSSGYLDIWTRVDRNIDIDKSELVNGVERTISGKPDREKVYSTEKGNKAVEYKVNLLTKHPTQLANLKKHHAHIVKSEPIKLGVYKTYTFSGLRTGKDYLFYLICNNSGKPTVKVDGFRQTSFFKSDKEITKGEDKCVYYFAKKKGETGAKVVFSYSRNTDGHIVIYEQEPLKGKK